MFCRYLLGVQKQTNTIGILLELGMVPVTLYAIKAAIKNWERVTDNRSNILLHMSIKDAAKENLVWISNIRNCLVSNGMLNMFLEKKTSPVHKIVFQRLSDHFHQNAFETINNNNSKLRTYGLLKSKIGIEEYLLTIRNIKNRIAMTKLRLSNHTLLIETGRHLKLEQTERVCPFCPNTIEDELHFLLHCPTYQGLRTKFLSPTLNTSHSLSDKEKFCLLLTNKMNTNTVAAYIKHAFVTRKDTLDTLAENGT